MSIEDVTAAVQQELQGPDELRRLMQLKIRQLHNLNAPRELLYDVMYDLESRRSQKLDTISSEKEKKNFHHLIMPIQRVNLVWSR